LAKLLKDISNCLLAWISQTPKTQIFPKEKSLDKKSSSRQDFVALTPETAHCLTIQ
jgi:hypothetical protein